MKAYFVYGVAMFIFFRKLISASMFSQMNHPLFLFGENEKVYQWFLASGIPQFVTSNPLIASLFDVSLLVCAIGLLLSSKRIFAFLFSAVVLIYFLTYNVVSGHHYHGMAGLLVMSMVFWFKKEEKFNLVWDGARYYLLYIFVSAALWKIFRGSAFYNEQLSNILMGQQIDMLLQNPDNFKSKIAAYLISHPSTSHLVLLGNVLLQLIFAVGFFTKKFDRVLLVLFVLFCVMNYLVMSIISTELLILGLTLLNWDWLERYFDKKGFFTPEPA